MNNFSIKEIEMFSNKILEDYDNKIPGLIFKEKQKITNEDALLIQSNVAKLRKKRGEEIIGYKIGCVSKDTQKKMGFNQPACGYLWKSELHKSETILNKKDYSNPAMEAEFGIRFNRDLHPKEVSFEYILASIDTIHPIIEIHNLIFYGDKPYGAEHISNNAINAGVVCGLGIDKPKFGEITDLKLIYDKIIIDKWTNKIWPIDMLSAVEWFVMEQAKINNQIKKGDLILTGAYGPPIPIVDKKLIEVNSSLFGNVSAIFK